MIERAKRLLFGCALGLFFFLSVPAFADAPPPPGGDPTGGGAGSNATPIGGGGASIEGGLLILVVLGAGYGAKKWYDARLNASEAIDNKK